MKKFMPVVLLIGLTLTGQSCAVYFAGQPVVSVPEFYADTYVEFTGCDDLRNPRQRVQENLGSGGVAELWKGSGEFRLFPSTTVKQAYVNYDGRTRNIGPPNWSWSVGNRQDNGNRTMTVTVIYQPEDRPQREWTGTYSVISNNLAELRRRW